MSAYSFPSDEYQSLLRKFSGLNNSSSQNQLNDFVAEFSAYMQKIIAHYSENDSAFNSFELSDMRYYYDKLVAEAELSNLTFDFIKDCWEKFELNRALLHSNLNQAAPMEPVVFESEWRRQESAVGIRPCR